MPDEDLDDWAISAQYCATGVLVPRAGLAVRTSVRNDDIPWNPHTFYIRLHLPASAPLFSLMKTRFCPSKRYLVAPQFPPR